MGKTLSAETRKWPRRLEISTHSLILTVAELPKAPPYVMSAAELGENTREVECTLERVLNLAAKWKAILLLDECDIFLEQRRDSDLVRNKIVSNKTIAIEITLTTKYT